MAPNGKTIGKNNSIVVMTLLLLLVGSSAAEKLSLWGQLKEGITQSLFPRVEVTLYNESDEDVLYMCSFGRPKHKSLRVLEAGKQFSWKFTQFAFPLHWCYLYVNDVRQGFFWAYGVRSRCLKCFWKVGQFPYLYRSDRNRWERQQLFPPPNIRFAGQP